MTVVLPRSIVTVASGWINKYTLCLLPPSLTQGHFFKRIIVQQQLVIEIIYQEKTLFFPFFKIYCLIFPPKRGGEM